MRINNQKLKDTVKSFGQTLVLNIAVQAVRGHLNSWIKDVTPDQLILAIQQNQPLVGNIPPEIIKNVNNLKKRYGQYLVTFDELINTDLVLGWMEQDHPKLYSTILNSQDLGSLDWFDRQITSIKQQILYGDNYIM